MNAIRPFSKHVHDRFVLEHEGGIEHASNQISNLPCARTNTPEGITRLRVQRIFLIVVFLASGSMAWAQVSAPVLPLPGYKNSFSGGLSYGVQNDRDADFWGWSLDYGRQLTDNWIGAVALTWDRETEQFDDRPDMQADTFTLVGTISYEIASRVSLTTGLGKGIADTDNSAGTMKFTSGDWGTGIALGYSIPGLPHFIRDSISLSAAYEYNISKRETSVSFDLSIGLSY